MRICLITPWPPQHTGIADYAYDLAWGLVDQGYHVSVITEAKDLKPLTGVNFYQPDWLDGQTVRQFDQLLYQMGNNSSFHVFQLPLIFRFPGVIHLHDMVLHHLMAWLLYAHGSRRFYRAVLAKWYGPVVAEGGWEALDDGCGLWDKSTVSDIPFFEEVVQYASAIVTHSRFAANKIQDAFPKMAVRVLPQLYREVLPRKTVPRQFFHIGIFGGLDPNKRVDWVIDACLAAQEAGCKIQLHIAGNIHESCKYLLEKIDQSPLADFAHVHGRIEHKAFLQLISEMDLCVALRYPTMGETSAVVMRALQAGTPVVVSDVGWYAELPSFLPRLSPEGPNELEKLTDLLIRLSQMGPEYQILLHETRLWVESECNFAATVEQYADFLLSAGVIYE